MEAAWRIAIDWLAGRPARTALLTIAVMLASGLIVAVASGIASINAAFEQRATRTIGASDLRVERAGGSGFSPDILNIVRRWPEVRAVAPRSEHALPLRNRKTGASEVAVGHGVDPAPEQALRAQILVRGRFLTSDDEIVPDSDLASRLGVDVGDTIAVQRFGEPILLRVVGVAPPPPLGTPIRAPAFVTIATLGAIANEPTGAETLVRIDIALQRGVDPFKTAAAHESDLPSGLVLRPTARILANVEKNISANRIGFVIISILAFLAASFIILTGLTTGVTERERELGVLRSIGAAKGQLFTGQLLVGGWIGLVGGALGAPLGIGLAYIATILYSDQLSAGLHISSLGVAMGIFGSLGSGVGGALAPAIAASRTSPLSAIASRARTPSARSIAIVSVAGLACVAAQLALALLTDNGQHVYWLWVLFGAPLLFTGYFLLGVPITLAVAHLAGPGVSAALRLPRSLLASGVAQTPFRHGLTAGSLMGGLAIMVSIWTNGDALLRDWIGAIRFPDAFAHAWRGMSEEDRDRIADLPYVTETCAITLLGVQTNAFGVRALRDVGTTFVAFEPEPFFHMTTLNFVEGDRDEAIAALKSGGAVMVAREFRVARGLGVGDSITLSYNGKPVDFRIVAVVDSPGIDLASKYFEIGQERQRLALHAVFGSRADLRGRFGEDAIHLLQIDLDDSVDDGAAIAGIRAAVSGTLLAVGSGREIKQRIEEIGKSSMRVLTGVAIIALIISCFGVGSVIAASVQGRRFEFGVLRSVGADASLLRRIIFAEALVIAIAAALLGATMGLQASWMSQRLYRLLAGLELRLVLPMGPIAFGWSVLFALTLASAAPPALLVGRQTPRALLTTKGS